jgi:hypothetical protein
MGFKDNDHFIGNEIKDGMEEMMAGVKENSKPFRASRAKKEDLTQPSAPAMDRQNQGRRLLPF